MRSSSPSDESKIIRYSFQKPGYVRMDFTQPHSGAVLIFNPVSGKVTLWPFGVGSLPILHLSPTNSLIQDERGHRVDRSDIGVLLGNIRHLQREGTMTTVGKENLAGRATTHVSVVGPGTIVVDGVHRYDVWLDNYHGLPAKVISYAPDGQRLELCFWMLLSLISVFPPISSHLEGGCIMADYQFSTVWRVEASIQEVWDVFSHPDQWPEWWGSLERIVEIKKGDVQGIGALHRYTWKGALPYRLTFDINVLNILPCSLLEGQASGAVEGRGVWYFSASGAETIVRYDWNVRTTIRWMNYLAPLAAPVFRWNHDTVMREGARGLARKLATNVYIF